ncbi:MAG: tRNA (N(6)-L-threonylcarbamoyladenosine(37)-C(2))-methylthiotransferase MtaB [Candidatus Omnitrophota bacterium]
MVRIFFNTIGCRTNQYETAVLKSFFGKMPEFQTVSNAENADIAVINTCTVTENSDSDTRKSVHRLVRLNPKIRIALTGCQAQLQPDLLKKLPNVHWVIGNKEKFNLPRIIHSHLVPVNPVILTPAMDSARPFTVAMPGINPDVTRANIKIQDGCNNFCTYCEVPFARGPARSRIFKDILNEAEELAERGYQELVLTGINIGAYDFKGKNLIDIINSLENIDLIKRVRISSIEPTQILESLINHMAQSKKLCRFLHVPLQHGQNTILKKMGRRYAAEDASRLIRKAKDTVKDICIGTDVIVGFPGETEKHFQALIDFLTSEPVDYFHVFSFSDRPNAKAGHYKNQVKTETIRSRSETLRALSLRKRGHFYNSQLGLVTSVLFEQRKDGEWKGLTDNFIPVSVISNSNLKNKFRRVKLIRVRGQIMRGEVIH